MAHVAHQALLGYDPEAILKDGCPECERRANSGLRGILELDANNLNRLWRRMLNERMSFQVNDQHQDKWGRYRSACEQQAGEQLYLLGVLEEKRRNPSDTWDPDRFDVS